MKLNIIIYTLLLLSFATTENTGIEENVDILTRNFFANLQEDPRLKGESFSESSKIYIDKLVENYLNLMKQAVGSTNHMVIRRSLPIDNLPKLTQDYTGIDVVSGFKELFNIQAMYPKDMVLFYHEYDGYKQWYGIVLEGEHQSMANTMVIYKIKHQSELEEITQAPVRNGTKLGVQMAEETVFIAVAEYNPLKQTYYEETAVFEFTKNEDLRKIQSLNIQYANDVTIWQDDYNLFLSFAQYMRNTSNQVTYEVDTPIYKWLGKHFDIIHEIRTYGAKRITPFMIGKSHFIAVANFQNDYGKTNIYSEIFKYDLDTEEFKSYQKILTNAAVDVKHFHFVGNYVDEHFLVFANLFEVEIDGSQNYETDSIIYKYVEGYFMPFQSFKLIGAMEWLPIMSADNAFVLLVACKFEGIKAFQYNGWKFVDSPVQYTNGVFSKGVIAMHSYQFKNQTIIAIVNENNHQDMPNIYEVTFAHQNELSQFQENMLNWCEHSIKSYQDISFDKYYDEAILQQQQSQKAGVHSGNLEMFKVEDVNQTIQDNFNEIKTKIIQQNNLLDEIEKQIELSLKLNDTNEFQGNITIKKLILNNNASFNTLNVKHINTIDVLDILQNVININEGFTIKNTAEFEDARIENKVSPKIINGRPAATLIYRNQDYHLGELVVNGTVTFKNEFNVNGKVGGIEFTTQNVLLNKGDQTLQNLDTKILNVENLDMNTVSENFTFLSAENVYVTGFVNNVDVETLYKYALRRNGTQVITGKYSFDSLHVDNVVVEQISGKQIPDDFILTRGGSYEIDDDVQFDSDLFANNIQLSERLNGIPVVNGKLEVLLSNVPHTQHIRGIKKFENLDLLNPIKLQGKINSTRLERMNPVTTLDEELVLNGDYIISGNVSIEELLKASDIQTTFTPIFSIQRLWNKGLKLVEQQIPVHLQFQQQLQVDELIADKINGLNVNSFIIMGSEEPQRISGWKTFEGDINILGSTKATNINGINLQELESNVLKTTGKQTLAGKHHFQTVIANRYKMMMGTTILTDNDFRVNNIKTRLGNNLWENVITTNTNQKINGTTIIAANSVQINSLQTKTLNSLHINGYNFNALMNDTAFRGRENKLLGNNKFQKLTVTNLAVQTLDLDQVPKAIENARATFQFDTNINLPNNIFIENIFFNNEFNGIPSENFGHQWASSNLVQTIESDQNFDKLIIYGKLFVESGFINDVNVIDISENSIKIDEHYHFGTVTFSNGLASAQGVSLEGTFESLYLNDIVQSNTQLEQTMSGQTIFNNNVAIYGEVRFVGLVSGFNISNLCKFAFPNDYNNGGPFDLHVKGNAYFAKGPIVQYINTVPVKHILENAWFQNREVDITGNLQFDKVIFNRELTVEGLIDDIKPQQIEQTYFSKTKDQNITAAFDFDNNVIFRNGLYAPQAIVEGTVCGLNLEDFIHTAMLDGYDQVFENIIYLDICEVENLNGEYLVNGLNLETDVMRYDRPNIVTGKKIIENVETHSMILEHNIKVQDIDLLWWLQNAVLKQGTFSISGEVLFHNYTHFSNHLSSQGLVNGRIFNQDSVMLKSLPQTITGNKILLGDSNFESIKLKSYLNGFNISEFLTNLAYKNKNNTFKSPLHFNTEITATNINIEKLYQGVNISKLIHNLTRFASVENYQEHYEKLLNTSYKVKASLSAQAYFVDRYEVKQIFNMVHTTIPLTFENSTDQYLACIMEGNQNYRITFNVWNKTTESFQPTQEIQDIDVPQELNYIQKVMFQGKEIWYIENKNQDGATDSHSYEASIYDVTKEGLIRLLPLLHHNGTNSVTTLVLPHQNNRSCIFLLFSQNPMLYCEQQIEDQLSVELRQIFDANNGIAVTNALVQDIPCIFIVNQGTVNDQPRIDVWKYDATTSKFNIEQYIYITSPNNIDTAFYRGTSYLIVASGHLQNAKHAGLLNIYKYDTIIGEFVIFQNINLNAPLQVQFTELPTSELLLYVVTENPAEPLIIYSYEGVSGFNKKIIASTIPQIINLKSFSTVDNRHFILAKNVNETQLIEGLFKGFKYL